MGGEASKVVKMQRKGQSSVFDRGGLGARVAALEAQMEKVLTDLPLAIMNSAKAAENTAELLAIANATKGAFGFIKKHGPKAISFGAGIMTILGFGNPELWKYIGHFFGG